MIAQALMSRTHATEPTQIHMDTAHAENICSLTHRGHKATIRASPYTGAPLRAAEQRGRYTGLSTANAHRQLSPPTAGEARARGACARPTRGLREACTWAGMGPCASRDARVGGGMFRLHKRHAGWTKHSIAFCARARPLSSTRVRVLPRCGARSGPRVAASVAVCACTVMITRYD